MGSILLLQVGVLTPSTAPLPIPLHVDQQFTDLLLCSSTENSYVTNLSVLNCAQPPTLLSYVPFKLRHKTWQLCLPCWLCYLILHLCSSTEHCYVTKLCAELCPTTSCIPALLSYILTQSGGTNLTAMLPWTWVQPMKAMSLIFFYSNLPFHLCSADQPLLEQLCYSSMLKCPTSSITLCWNSYVTHLCWSAQPAAHMLYLCSYWKPDSYVYLCYLCWGTLPFILTANNIHWTSYVSQSLGCNPTDFVHPSQLIWLS